MDIPGSQNLALLGCVSGGSVCDTAGLVGPTISSLPGSCEQEECCHEKSAEQKCSSNLVIFSLENVSCHPLLDPPLH